MRLWHGSDRQLDAFGDHRRGEVHLGTRDQAAMRNAAWLHEVEIPDGLKLKRVRDTGEVPTFVHDAARRQGYDGVVYLNRYEGMTTEIIERLAASGKLGGLDDMSDTAFRKLVPEAEDSYAIFDPADCRIVSVLSRAEAFERDKPEMQTPEDPA